MKKIYWSEKEIPALQGLSFSEKQAAKRSVVPKVWRHWQVWLPFLLLLAGYGLFFLLVPQFPYRLPIVFASVLALSRLASLPFNFYLQHYLGERREGL